MTFSREMQNALLADAQKLRDEGVDQPDPLFLEDPMTTTRQARKGTDTIDVTIALKLATEDLVSALESGNISGPHGYAYWCNRVALKTAMGSREPLNHGNLTGWVLSGRDLEVTEFDETTGEETKHTLTREKLIAGFGCWIVRCAARGDYDADTGVTHFEIDAPQSDMILQYALFGEQRYG